VTSSSRRGYDFERRVADHLRRNGSAGEPAEHVVRPGGSRGPADLYAFYPPDSPLTTHLTKVELVQCKKHGRMAPDERTKLLDLAERLHAKPLLAMPGPKGRGVLLVGVERPL
jgi:hypothetical protein